MFGIKEDKPTSLPASFCEEGEHSQPVYEFGNSENFKKLLIEREVDVKEQQAKSYRYETKKSLDDLIRTLINGELFDMFEGQILPKIPITFKDSFEYT
jgi:hypothetical protein